MLGFSMISLRLTPSTAIGKMSEILTRFLVGVAFQGIAILLIIAGSPIFSLIPAGTSVYILGSLLLDVMKGIA